MTDLQSSVIMFNLIKLVGENGDSEHDELMNSIHNRFASLDESVQNVILMFINANIESFNYQTRRHPSEKKKYLLNMLNNIKKYMHINILSPTGGGLNKNSKRSKRSKKSKRLNKRSKKLNKRSRKSKRKK